MLRQILILLIIYLSSSVQDSKAANQDYILSIDNPYDSHEGYIETKEKSTQGKVMSVCSWITRNDESIAFFDAVDAETTEIHLNADVYLNYSFIGGTSTKEGNFFVYVQDCNLKNMTSTSWFHVCVIKKEPTVFFYLNGCPSENYVDKDNNSDIKSDNVTIRIGDTYRNGGHLSLYQINAFDRALTAKEVQNMYNCKSMNGDLISWKDITSKSKDFTFGEKVQLIQAPVPCPTPPPYKPINCETGEPLEFPCKSEAGEPGSSSPFGDPGSSSSSGDPGSSSSSGDPGSSSSSGDPGSSSPSEDSGSSSPSRDPGSSSSSRDPGSSSPSADSGSNLSSGDPGSSSSSGDPGSSSPSAASGRS